MASEPLQPHRRATIPPQYQGKQIALRLRDNLQSARVFVGIGINFGKTRILRDQPISAIKFILFQLNGIQSTFSIFTLFPVTPLKISNSADSTIVLPIGHVGLSHRNGKANKAGDNHNFTYRSSNFGC